MIDNIKNSVKPILSDRGYLSLAIGLILIALVFVIFSGVVIKSSDIQVVTQYSAFGDSHFFKNQWTYLYSFTVFGLIVALLHPVIMVKLYDLDKRGAGLVFGWLSILVIIVAFIIFKSVVSLAYV